MTAWVRRVTGIHILYQTPHTHTQMKPPQLDALAAHTTYSIHHEKHLTWLTWVRHTKILLVWHIYTLPMHSLRHYDSQPNSGQTVAYVERILYLHYTRAVHAAIPYTLYCPTVCPSASTCIRKVLAICHLCWSNTVKGNIAAVQHLNTNTDFRFDSPAPIGSWWQMSDLSNVTKWLSFFSFFSQPLLLFLL